jgi:peptidoglycan hydrolase-like protein with peptidoglycan-binding domain
MRSNRFTKLGIGFLTSILMLAQAFATTVTPAKTSAKHKSKFSHLRKVATWKRHGQQQISGDRAREIQAALIREHYLDGQPTGVWDTRTADAMRRFQADQGWQSKVIPDSRALIKLGLGPSHENDLNPDLMGAKTFSPLRGPDASAVTEVPQR